MNTFVNGQLSYLGIGKRYFFAMEEARTEHYSARQTNLRSALRSGAPARGAVPRRLTRSEG